MLAPCNSVRTNKQIRLDSKGVFAEGLRGIRGKLEERYYTSVATFSSDLASVFSSVIGFANLSSVADANNHHDLNDPTIVHKSLTAEQKEHKKLAKRIIKSIQALMDDATRKEAELARKPFEKELANLDALLDMRIRARTQSLAFTGTESILSVKAPSLDGSLTGVTTGAVANEDLVDGGDFTDEHLQASAEQSMQNEINQDKEDDPMETTDDAVIRLRVGPGNATIPIANDGEQMKGVLDDGQAEASADSVPALSNSGSTNPSTTHHGPPSPDQEQDLLAPLKYGGIPWYAQPFDPDGTTLYDERWTGREVLRHMSEELSDMDEEDVRALQDEEMADAALPMPSGEPATQTKASVPKASRKKSRSRRYR